VKPSQNIYKSIVYLNLLSYAFSVFNATILLFLVFLAAFITDKASQSFQCQISLTVATIISSAGILLAVGCLGLLIDHLTFSQIFAKTMWQGHLNIQDWLAWVGILVGVCIAVLFAPPPPYYGGEDDDEPPEPPWWPDFESDLRKWQSRPKVNS
jgi:hypothetical protein